jgi:hypothetical protein
LVLWEIANFKIFFANAGSKERKTIAELENLWYNSEVRLGDEPWAAARALKACATMGVPTVKQC